MNPSVTVTVDSSRATARLSGPLVLGDTYAVEFSGLSEAEAAASPQLIVLGAMPGEIAARTDEDGRLSMTTDECVRAFRAPPPPPVRPREFPQPPALPNPPLHGADRPHGSVRLHFYVVVEGATLAQGDLVLLWAPFEYNGEGDPIQLKGEKGDKGDRGEPGAQGVPGRNGVYVAMDGLYAFHISQGGDHPEDGHLWIHAQDESTLYAKNSTGGFLLDDQGNKIPLYYVNANGHLIYRFYYGDASHVELDLGRVATESGLYAFHVSDGTDGEPAGHLMLHAQDLSVLYAHDAQGNLILDENDDPIPLFHLDANGHLIYTFYNASGEAHATLDIGDVRGPALTWSDLTAEQKASLKGDKGDDGDKGDQGDPLTWDDLTEEQKASLKGDKGDPGQDGLTEQEIRAIVTGTMGDADDAPVGGSHNWVTSGGLYSMEQALIARILALGQKLDNIRYDLAGAYHFKGSVATYDDLPETDRHQGDVWNVRKDAQTEDGMNYAWTGDKWDALGLTMDLSAYLRKDELWSQSVYDLIGSNITVGQWIVGTEEWKDGVLTADSNGVVQKDGQNVYDLTVGGVSIQSMSSDVSQAIGSISTIGGDVSTLNSDVSTLKSDVSTLQNDTNNLSGSLSIAQADIQAIENGSTTLPYVRVSTLGANDAIPTVSAGDNALYKFTGKTLPDNTTGDGFLLCRKDEGQILVAYDGSSDKAWFRSGGVWVEVAPKAALAAVATSGSYADLTNKPDRIWSENGKTAVVAGNSGGQIAQEVYQGYKTSGGTNHYFGWEPLSDTTGMPTIDGYSDFTYFLEVGKTASDFANNDAYVLFFCTKDSDSKRYVGNAKFYNKSYGELNYVDGVAKPPGQSLTVYENRYAYSDIATTAFVQTAVSGKQNVLTFDSTPTASSDNPVKSGGVKSYVDGKTTLVNGQSTVFAGSDGTLNVSYQPTLGDLAAHLNLGDNATLADVQQALSLGDSATLEDALAAVQVPVATGRFATEAFVASGLRYDLVTVTPTVSGTAASATLQDRAINTISVASGVTTLNLTFPAAVSGKARDFFLRIVTAGTSLATVTFADGSSAVDIEIGSSDLADWNKAGTHLVLFTEVAAGKWLASKRLEEASS